MPSGERAFETRILPLEAQIVAVVRDITERKRAEVEREHLRADAERQSARLRALLANLAEGVTIFDGEGRILLRNAALREILGLEDDAIQERLPRLLSVMRPDGTPVPVSAWPVERLLRGETFTAEELVIRRSDGTRRRILTSAALIPGEAGRTMALGILVTRDITELRRLEEERADFVRAITMICDNRSPRRPCMRRRWKRGLGQLALEDEAAKASRLAATTRRMATMLEDLLTVDRPGTLEPERADLDLVALVAQVVATKSAPRTRLESGSRAPWPSRRRARTQSTWDASSPTWSRTPSSTRRPARPITVRISEGDGLALVTVADRGPGIPPDEIPHLFERYYRARANHDRKGLGLGLYIARRLVEAQGGRVWVDGEPRPGDVILVHPAAGVGPPAGRAIRSTPAGVSVQSCPHREAPVH